MNTPRVIMKRGHTGANATTIQRETNETVKNYGFPWRHVRVDGTAGAATFKAIHLAAWLRGASQDQLDMIADGMLTEHAFNILVHKERRPEEWVKRERQRHLDAKALIKGHHESVTVDKDGLEEFDGKQVAGWMIPYLKEARERGWDGEVVSGYRTPAYSEQLCYNMCGAPSCPGRCAGRSTNHARYGEGEGAIDVSDYYTFGRIMREINAPLKNSLGSADPVHFSRAGN